MTSQIGQADAAWRRRRMPSAFLPAIAFLASLLAFKAAAATFTDVTAAVGLTHNQAASGQGHPMTGGVAAGDYDGDGLVDLFFTRTGGPAVLYRNTGSAFEDVSTAAGFTQTYSSSGVASGDVD